jgi:peptidoglycan/LPS O-acetylase OafA/YrhL
LSHSQELCLDLIRICMAQFIVLVHFLGLSQNETWLAHLPLSGLRVSAFFMLSGFLIFTTTWRKRHTEYTFRAFMLERAARLWVCLIPALIFSAIVAHSVIDLPDYPAERVTGPLQFVGNLLMLEDYPLFQILRRLGIDSPYFIGSYAAAEPYWTLPIELYLYVVFGYLFFFGYLRRSRPSLFASALFTLASGAVVYHAAKGPKQPIIHSRLRQSPGPLQPDRDPLLPTLRSPPPSRRRTPQIHHPARPPLDISRPTAS